MNTSRQGAPGLQQLSARSAGWVFDEIEKLHRKQLSAGALAHMPTGFLSRFYRMLAASKDCVVIADIEKTHDNQPRLSAFVAGSVSSRGQLVRFVRAHPLALAFDLLKLLASPRLLLRAITIFTKMQAGDLKTSDVQLLAIAVAPSHARLGLGRKLTAELARWFAENGHDSFDVVASDTQDAALAFYRKLGGRIVAQTDLGGLNSYVFKVPLDTIFESQPSLKAKAANDDE